MRSVYLLKASAKLIKLRALFARSNSSFVLITIIPIVGHDDVIHHSDVHSVCCLFEFLCKSIVFSARTQTSRGMIMYEGNLRGIDKKSFTEHTPHIDHCSRNASATHQSRSYHLEVLIEQEHVALFMREIAQARVIVSVNILR